MKLPKYPFFYNENLYTFISLIFFGLNILESISRVENIFQNIQYEKCKNTF